MGVPDFSVSGQTVLITGGTGGIGMAFAEAFLAAGARVIVTDLKPPATPLPAGMSYRELDVRSDAAVTALAAATPTLHTLIHCAGRLARFKEYEMETFTDVVDIHLFGAMRLATAFREQLKTSKGSIIFIGSMFSYFGASRIPAYTAAKTAIIGLTKALATGFVADGIRVNAIAPGWIETEISRPGREDPEFNRRLLERIPTGRWAKPAELAGTAIFLASPASHLVNGVTIPVDDGYVAA